MKVAIVILNWNGLADTLECLQSLATVKSKAVLDILVIDNGSENEKEIKVIAQTFPHVTTICNKENQGFSGGNNQGFAWAKNRKADYILILNNDTTVKSDFLEQLLSLASKKPRAIVSPKILYVKTEKIQSMGLQFNIARGGGSRRHKNEKASNYMDEYRQKFLSGCCWLMPSRALVEIGLFDEIFFAYYEDMDYSRRAQNAGYELYVSGKSVIYHKESSSTDFNHQKIYYNSRNLSYFMHKYSYSQLHVMIAQIFLFAGLSLRFKTNFKWLRSYIEGVRDGQSLAR